MVINIIKLWIYNNHNKLIQKTIKSYIFIFNDNITIKFKFYSIIKIR